jgi:hypothetical protein
VTSPRRIEQRSIDERPGNGVAPSRSNQNTIVRGPHPRCARSISTIRVLTRAVPRTAASFGAHQHSGLRGQDQSPSPKRVPDTHCRVRRDKVDTTGCVTLRYESRLLRIGIGPAHKGERGMLLIADRDVSETGELIRHLTIDPARDYQRRSTQ